MGTDRAVRVEQGYGCYCWARIGQLGLSKGRAVRVGLKLIGLLGVRMKVKGRAVTVGQG